MLAAMAVCVLMSSAKAGQIITENLPSGDVIIAVDGTADGAAAYSGPDYNLWYQPFNVNGQLLEYTFRPGTYDFRVIDSTDAAAMFPRLTASQVAKIGDGAWTFNSPWVTDLIAFDSSAATNPQESQLFTVALRGQLFSNASEAYSAAIAGGYYDQIVLGDRATGPVQDSYTFTRTTTLIFAVPDYYLPDNGGVDSLLVSSATVPEPSAVVLMGIAGGSLGLLRAAWLLRRRASRSGFPA
jgi:hypothetical protein